MPKNNFLRQRDGYSCGPIAIMNALRWSNSIKIKYQDIKYFRQILDTTKENGTCPEKMDKILKEYDHIIDSYWDKSICFLNIIYHLEQSKDNAIILHYNEVDEIELSNGKSILEREGHYVLLIGLDDNQDFYVANMYDNRPSLRICPREELKVKLRRTTPYKNFGWMLRKV